MITHILPYLPPPYNAYPVNSVGFYTGTAYMDITAYTDMKCMYVPLNLLSLIALVPQSVKLLTSVNERRSVLKGKIVRTVEAL
jgi:hypothetical protein